MAQRHAQRADGDEAVGGLVDAVVDVAGGLRAELAVNRLLLGERLLLETRLLQLLEHGRQDLVVPGIQPGELGGLHGERRAEERAVDLLAAARPFPREQRRADAVRHLDARRVVGHRGIDVRGYAVLELALAGHEPGHRLHHDVVAAAPGERARGAEGRVLAIDEPRVKGRERLVVDAEALGHARPVVDDHDVRVRNELVDDLARLGAGHVQCDALLAAVQARVRARLLGHELDE
ncbi:MAG: hypothetical protein WD557_07610 [Dehalococcoidia bacterium]